MAVGVCAMFESVPRSLENDLAAVGELQLGLLLLALEAGGRFQLDRPGNESQGHGWHGHATCGAAGTPSGSWCRRHPRWTMIRRPLLRVALPLFAVLALGSCEYARLLRPSVLKQLNPRVVRLVNYLPEIDEPNEAIVGRLLAHGGLGHARPGDDGVMRATVRAPRQEFIWEPAIIVMPRGGALELDFSNEDTEQHAAFLPSQDGGRKMMFLPIHERGRARLELDAPGYYFFGCPISNHAGRGMLGLIIVEGDVPAEARLDRPRQPQPSRF